MKLPQNLMAILIVIISFSPLLFTSLVFTANCKASVVAQMVTHLPAMWEIWVQFLGREAPLEKEMAIHSSILAWRIPWTKELGRLQSMGSQKVGHD